MCVRQNRAVTASNDDGANSTSVASATKNVPAGTLARASSICRGDRSIPVSR